MTGDILQSKPPKYRPQITGTNIPMSTHTIFLYLLTKITQNILKTIINIQNMFFLLQYVLQNAII